jgi:hypothetical protein
MQTEVLKKQEKGQKNAKENHKTDKGWGRINEELRW